MAIHNFVGTYNMRSVSPQAGRASFTIRDKEGKAVGELNIMFKHFIDHSKKQGSHGKIRNPGLDYFPSRIVLDRGTEEAKPKAAPPIFMSR